MFELVSAAALSAATWRLSGGNHLGGWTLVLWVSSVAAWVAAFRARGTEPPRARGRIPGGALLALAASLLLGAWLRFSDLSLFPPDMTSDHVEKLLDVERIADGARPIFLTTNGGREPLQFYALALLHAGGLPLGFGLLKLLSGLEGLLAISAVFFLAWELAGAAGESAAVAASAAALLTAAGWWPVLLSRLGLRIALAPVFSALVGLYAVRAFRGGARGDFLAAGLVLGTGLYAYQNVRILPLLLLLGAAGAFALARDRDTRRRLAYGFGALTLVAAAVFVPLGRFMVDDPGSFWSRTRGRLIGGNAAPVHDVSDVLAKNFARSILMFNVSGDRSWITGTSSGRAELDPATGVLMVGGLVAWGAGALRSRDRAAPLALLALPVLVLPTALAIAMPQEVPSATRASAVLPFVFAFAGLGTAWAWDALRSRLGVRRSLLVALGAVSLSVIALVNAAAYAESARGYRASSLPHAQLGALLSSFARGRGALGNAFMVGYPHSWDHRAIALEAGAPRWPNALTPPIPRSFDERVAANAGGAFALDTHRPLLFFLDGRDAEGLLALRARFPAARVRRVGSFDRTRDFLVLLEPAGVFP